jgi:hypothetical protein
MGGLTAAQFNSGEDEDVTRGIIAAQVYLRTNMKVAWDDPCEQLNIDDEVFKITDLDKKDWALQFEPPATVQEEATEKTLLLKIESWEQPTQKKNEVYFKLMEKYLKLILADEEEGEEEGEFEEPAELKEVKRKIESVCWKKGKGNSYVVNAYDIGADGKIDRTKETEYKIDVTLLGLIKAATMAGFNSKVNFVSPEAMEDGLVEEEEEEEEADYHSERDDLLLLEEGNGDEEEGAVKEGSEEDGDEGDSEEEASGDREFRGEGEGGEVADELSALI